MINTILDDRGYGVRKKDVDPAVLKKHMKALTFKPVILDGYAYAPPKPVCMFRESPKRIWMPKFYGIKHFGTPTSSNERIGEPIEVAFDGTLKPDQTKILNDVIPVIKETGGGILCLPTGFGKTVCAIYIACQLGVKTLWVTHKSNLMEQTRERFESFTNETVGTIQQKITDTDHPFVIGMLQSISMRDYPPELFEQFGLVIFDEAHHVPSQVFSRCLWKLTSRYTLGLSATLERKDKLTDIAKIAIGPILATVESQIKIPIVRKVKAEYDDDNLKIEHVNKAGKPDTAKLLSDIINDVKRNSIIIKEVRLAYEQGRSILILSDRVAHCEELYNRIKFNIKPREEGKNHVGLYIGSKRKEELIIANFCDIIVATYNMCAEGYDNSNINTVVLSTSKRDIRQAAGRVLGLRSGGGFRPLIIDISDTWGAALNQAYARTRWYKENEFDVENVGFKQEKIVKDEVIEKYKPIDFTLDDE